MRSTLSISAFLFLKNEARSLAILDSLIFGLRLSDLHSTGNESSILSRVNAAFPKGSSPVVLRPGSASRKSHSPLQQAFSYAALAEALKPQPKHAEARYLD